MYSAVLEPIPYLNVVAGRELNPNNPDNSWLLLKKIGTDSGKVLYAGTMVKIDKKYLVSPWQINDAAVEKSAICLVDAINMAKKWLDETEGEFILDPDYYGIIWNLKLKSCIYIICCDDSLKIGGLKCQD